MMKISLFASCMNRTENLLKAYPSWKVQNVDEIIILDYGSETPIEIPDTSSNTHVYRVEADEWRIGRANNIAASLCSGDIFIKTDCDFIYNVDIAEKINLKPNTFAGGHWKLGPIAGFMACWSKDFYMVNGYNERFTKWGGDDTDFFKRLNKYGIRQKLIRKEWIYHIDHSDKERLASPVPIDNVTRTDLHEAAKINMALAKSHPWTCKDKRTTYKDIDIIKLV